jgi:hypothetical protein
MGGVRFGDGAGEGSPEEDMVMELGWCETGAPAPNLMLGFGGCWWVEPRRLDGGQRAGSGQLSEIEEEKEKDRGRSQEGYIGRRRYQGRRRGEWVTQSSYHTIGKSFYEIVLKYSPFL